MEIKNLAIFISGSGTNLQEIIDKSRNGYLKANIKLVVSDNENAYGLKRAKNAKIDTFIVKNYKELLSELDKREIDLIVLAGFLSIVPKDFIDSFKGHILNIHPSLIPKYCGKGMYGSKVHELVLENKEGISGVTVHFVDDKIDHGTIIARDFVPVYNSDKLEDLERRIHKTEHRIYPRIIKTLLEGDIIEK